MFEVHFNKVLTFNKLRTLQAPLVPESPTQTCSLSSISFAPNASSHSSNVYTVISASWRTSGRLLLPSAISGC